MSLWGIFISSFFIGFSGAMMPGPMLGVTIDGSLKRGFIAGPLTVLGHGILEFTLVMVMAFGLKDFFLNPVVGGIIGLVGGTFLAWMGYGMVKSSLKKEVSLTAQEGKDPRQKSLILAGALVSLTNPYFVMWWASTGMESIRQAYVLGIAGILAFYFGHILSDLTWYMAVSAAFSKGKKLMSDRVYRWVILSLGGLIIVFSIKFIIGGGQMLYNYWS
ncbi:MAG: LysE family transporter [Clostridiales bacterium]|nr:LysE family transporter [Clostridiales bacterium]